MKKDVRGRVVEEGGKREESIKSVLASANKEDRHRTVRRCLLRGRSYASEEPMQPGMKKEKRTQDEGKREPSSCP